MTGTVDIQELKGLAIGAGEPAVDIDNYYRRIRKYQAAASPSTILALIEVAEAAQIVHRETMAREYADRELLVSALGALKSALTALEGVKK